MKYYKNLELARIYHVSEKSVRNWINAAQNGKLQFELYTKDGRQFIASTAKNQQLIEELVAKGRKYKNTRGQKVISASAQFYELYSQKQILDILSNIDIYREIPFQYTYFHSGAQDWDTYATRLLEENTSNTLTNTLNLLTQNQKAILALMNAHKTINVIDLGVGNCLPVKSLLSTLLERQLLNRYIGIDVSKDILEIAQRNIAAWFKGEIVFEQHIRDVNYDRFEDLLAEGSFRQGTDQAASIVLLLGDLLLNLRAPDHALQVINSSMGRNDILVFVTKLDSETSRRHFDFTAGEQSQLAQQEKFILDLLNIHEDFYEVEQFYDSQKHARFIRVKFTTDLSIRFDGDPNYGQIDLRKGESLLLWRCWHQSTLEAITQFDRNGFDLLHAAKTPNQEYLLTISKIKTSL